MARTVEWRTSKVLVRPFTSSWVRLIVLFVMFFLFFLVLTGCGRDGKTEVSIAEAAITSVGAV